MFDFRYYLFYLKASFIAPMHFKPKKCFVKDIFNCPIWNCVYHYNDNKYCQFCCNKDKY